MIQTYDFNEDEIVIAAKIFESICKEFNIECEAVEAEVTMVDKITIQEINRDTRGIDRPTDVLSFPNLEIILPLNFEDYMDYDFNLESNALMLGEIIICRPIMHEQALEYNHKISRECAFLITHGLLHLLGYDHINDDDRKKMRFTEDKILNNTIYKR